MNSATDTFEFFNYTIKNHVATITLNRPEKLNAMTKQMGMGYMRLLDRVDASDDVRVLVLTGRGRAFCAGADLTAKTSSFSKEGQSSQKTSTAINADGSIDWSHDDVRDYGGLITLRMYECKKPIIVAFNGVAAGIGVTLSLAADMRLAVHNAKFTMPFVRRGIVAESASSWFLSRIVGLPQALEWLLTGRTFQAEEALKGGLVRSLHEPDELLPAAYQLASEIANNTAPVSVALTRQLLWKMSTVDHPMDAHKIESRSIFSRARANDLREGVDSFLEKRPANFKDKVSEDMPEFYPWWDEKKYD